MNITVPGTLGIHCRHSTIASDQGARPVSPTTAPNMAPTPAVPYTTLPTIDQNVPAEKIAPPIPAEPRTNN
jgi:hypothetical protein